MQMDVHKTLYPFYTSKKMPCVTNMGVESFFPWWRVVDFSRSSLKEFSGGGKWLNLILPSRRYVKNFFDENLGKFQISKSWRAKAPLYPASDPCGCDSSHKNFASLAIMLLFHSSLFPHSIKLHGLLAGISSNSIVALSAKMSAFSIHMRQKAYCNLK